VSASSDRPGSQPRPYILAETSWKAVRETRFEVAVLPWGATEAHNYHLPYGTDTIQCDRVAAAAAARAWGAGARVIVLPTVPFGVQGGQLDIPLCLHVRPTTQARLLEDLARSLQAHGVRKLVLLNGHGGNDLRGIVRELQPQLELFLCLVDWYACLDPSPYFEEAGDHAGELETSVMLEVAPELVGPLEEAGDGAAGSFRLRGLREGWAWAPREWTRVSRDTGVGDPRAATREKGEAFLAAVAERIGGFLTELAAADPDDLYEPP
jgi:creatinine amidohydrolase